MTTLSKIIGMGSQIMDRLLPVWDENAPASEPPSLEHKAGRYHALKEKFAASAMNSKEEIFKTLSNDEPLSQEKLEELRANLKKFHHPDAVKARQEADIDEMNSNGYSMITVAARHGRVDALRIMAELKLDLGKADKQGWTARTEAAGRGHANVLFFLHEQGGDLGKPDGHNRKAANEGVRGGHLNVIKTLHARGVDFRERARDGQSAINLAEKLDRNDILEYMNGIYTNNPYEHGLQALER